MNPQEIAADIITRVEKVEEDYAAEDEGKQQQESRDWNRASSLGWAFDCPRHLCLLRMCPEKKTASPEMKAKFKEGRLQESMLKAEMRAAGVPLEPAKALVETNYKIKGQADDILVADGQRLTIDYKSTSSAMFREVSLCETDDDLFKSKHIWVRHYPVQMETYNYLYGMAGGFLIFKNKEGSPRKHLVWCGQANERMAQVLSTINEVNDRVKKEDPWPAEWKDACKGCGFVDYDFKPEERKDKVEIVNDEALAVMLSRRQELKAMFDEYEELDERVKVSLKLVDRDRFMVGDYIVSNTKYKKSSYEVPEEIRSQYKKTIELMRTTIKYLGDAL